MIEIKKTFLNYIIFDQSTEIQISVYISEMRYYVHHLHFLDYCPPLCRHVYHNTSAVVCSSLFKVRLQELQKAVT